MLTLAGRLLPQYNPQVEQEKIARIQRSFLERQKPQRIEELRKEAEELGMVLVKPEEIAQASGEGAEAPTPAPTGDAPEQEAAPSP